MAERDVHEEIAAQIHVIAAANLNLIMLLETSCPGPHKYVQHRDRKPPWCNACGYTGAGFRVKEAQ